MPPPPRQVPALLQRLRVPHGDVLQQAHRRGEGAPAGEDRWEGEGGGTRVQLPGTRSIATTPTSGTTSPSSTSTSGGRASTIPSCRHLHFMRNERDELYGFVAIVSNIGERGRLYLSSKVASWASAWASPCSPGWSSSTSPPSTWPVSATGGPTTEHSWRKHV